MLSTIELSLFVLINCNVLLSSLVSNNKTFRRMLRSFNFLCLTCKDIIILFQMFSECDENFFIVLLILVWILPPSIILINEKIKIHLNFFESKTTTLIFIIIESSIILLGVSLDKYSIVLKEFILMFNVSIIPSVVTFLKKKKKIEEIPPEVDLQPPKRTNDFIWYPNCQMRC